MAPTLSKLNRGKSSHVQPNSKRCHTLTLYLYSSCGRPHEIYMLDDDKDFGPKFGLIPLCANFIELAIARIYCRID